MKYEILRKYRAFGGDMYAVLYFPETSMQNEVCIDSEKEDLTAKANALYASLSAPQKSEEQKPIAIAQTKIIVDGKIIFSGTVSENMDLSTDMRKQFTVSAKVVAK
jgi:hypothetical protein